MKLELVKIFSNSILFVPLLLVVVVGLQQTFYNVNEGDGSVMACVQLSGSTERDIFVSLDALEETAQGKYNSQCSY